MAGDFFGTVHEAGDIICNMFGSIRRTGTEWSILVLGFAKYSKRSIETQVSYALKNIIEGSSQVSVKMVGRSKWLSVRQVVPSWSIMILIKIWDYLESRWGNLRPGRSKPSGGNLGGTLRPCLLGYFFHTLMTWDNIVTHSNAKLFLCIFIHTIEMIYLRRGLCMQSNEAKIRQGIHWKQNLLISL